MILTTESRRPAALSAAAFGCLLACLALLLASAPRAGAETVWEVTGRGWGHGIGMSQWGALGLAKKGKSWKQVLRHYYRHTKIGRTPGGEVRVLLQSGEERVEFTEATAACGASLDPAATYAAVRDGDGVRLEGPTGESLGGCGDSLHATGGDAIRVAGKGAYRGSLIVVPRGSGGLHAINAVALEAYLRGVVPNEMPADWPGDALRAQAVAARSYALATADGGLWDQYDDTRSQVYGGISSETPATNQAVAATAGRVVKHEGKVATTFFFSSSGGRTENIEFSFVGAEPKPYLRSVKDPHEEASPYHRWRETFSQSEIEARLGDLVQGSLQAIDVTRRGRSPRIVSARVVGSEGTSEVTGPTLQARLGLRSTWACFKKGGG
jgi:stage II sporulation protein D